MWNTSKKDPSCELFMKSAKNMTPEENGVLDLYVTVSTKDAAGFSSAFTDCSSTWAPQK